MSTLLIADGTDRSNCDHFKNCRYAGCEKIEGHVFWTEYISADICPVYDCVSKNTTWHIAENVRKFHVGYGMT